MRMGVVSVCHTIDCYGMQYAQDREQYSSCRCRETKKASHSTPACFLCGASLLVLIFFPSIIIVFLGID